MSTVMEKKISFFLRQQAWAKGPAKTFLSPTTLSDGGRQEAQKERNDSEVKSQGERTDLSVEEARTGERRDVCVREEASVPGVRLAQPHFHKLNIWL